VSSLAAASRSPARSSANADSASWALSSETAFPSVTYRASHRNAARWKFLLGVEEEQLQRLVERELPELPSSRLGSHQVALLHGPLEVCTERGDL
jgi:hypothetical protein